MSEESTPKLGRPSKFNGQILEKMLQLAELGKTHQQIADIIGVHVRTIENWMGKHPDIMWALKEAKQIADDLVEASLFSRAVGYSHPEEKIFQYEGSIVRANTTKHHPPDVTAALAWLHNRKPDEWRAKQPGEDDKTIKHTGEIAVVKGDLDDRVKQLKGES